MNLQTNWVAFQTMIAKETIRITRIWVQTLVPPVIIMSLYFVIFGRLVGSRIGEMGGFDYIQFIVPGLIMLSVITNSYNNVVSSFYSAKFQKYVEELLVAPVHPSIIVLGFTMGGVIRGITVGFLVTTVSLFFTTLPLENIFVIILTIFLTSVLFSLAGFLNALYAKSFDDISIIPTFVLTPLTYLGGIFYSIDMLPEFWQVISKLNPILYIVNSFRYGFLGISDIDIHFAILFVFSCCLGFLWINIRLIRLGNGLKG